MHQGRPVLQCSVHISAILNGVVVGSLWLRWCRRCRAARALGRELACPLAARTTWAAMQKRRKACGQGPVMKGDRKETRDRGGEGARVLQGRRAGGAGGEGAGSKVEGSAAAWTVAGAARSTAQKTLVRRPVLQTGVGSGSAHIEGRCSCSCHACGTATVR